MKKELKKNESIALRSRVVNAKKILKDKGCKRPKIVFFDTVFGKTFKQENIRLDNLWAGYTTDEKFTKLLEKFANEWESKEN